MGDVVGLDENRPHYALLDLEGNAHVLPVALVDDWVEGRNFDLERDGPVMRAIIRQWQEFLEEPDSTA